MNSIDDDIIAMMNTALDEAEKNFRGLVIGNDGANFSAGANIMALLMAHQERRLRRRSRRWSRRFQAANQRMRYSPIPVVAAPFGLTLGGGAEVTMGGNAIQASAELYMGLVEVGVGLIPGGGGNMQLLRNVYGPYAADKDFDPLPFLKKVFLTIGTAKVATSRRGGPRAGLPESPGRHQRSTATSCSSTRRRGCWAWRTRASGRRGRRTSGCRAGAARRPST